MYSPLKFEVYFLLKYFVIYGQVFLTFVASKSLKSFYTLYCVSERAKARFRRRTSHEPNRIRIQAAQINLDRLN